MSYLSFKQTQRPPATARYILRGHAAPVHALHLFANNLRLISGDAEGWIVIWDMVNKRPVASWKAHGGAVLEAKGFGTRTGMEIYTHGRDHKLQVWRIRIQDEDFLDKTLPVDQKETTATQSSRTQAQPWLLHSLPVNALNFCAFDMVFLQDSGTLQENPQGLSTGSSRKPSDNADQLPVLIAVPNALNSGAIDIFHLPLERRISTIPADTASNTGMVMAVRLLISSSSSELYAASAYEDGQVMVLVRRGRLNEQDISSSASSSSSVPWKWEKLYSSRPHSQPVLSIDVAPSKDYFLSSSADAVLVKHPIPCPCAVVGYLEESPLKTVNTKHAGQQGLCIRSDGKIFATAGWDCRTRVYSCKTMKELAVLKWHQDGCYAAAFAEVAIDSAGANENPPTMATESQSQPHERNGHEDTHLTRRTEGSSLAAVQQQRNQRAQRTHWLAAGSKDGKISLWDIY